MWGSLIGPSWDVVEDYGYSADLAPIQQTIFEKKNAPNFGQSSWNEFKLPSP